VADAVEELMGSAAGDGRLGALHCPVGYRLEEDGVTCRDVDECAEDPGVCGAHGDCRNLEGSYRCKCSAHYFFDGITCVEHCEPGLELQGTECVPRAEL